MVATRPFIPAREYPSGELLLQDTLSIPDHCRTNFNRVAAMVDETLTRDAVKDVRRIFLAGSGDLHNVAVVTELAFERLAGVPAEAMRSMEFGLYASPTVPEGSVLIEMSFSGKTARAVEAATLGRHAGAQIWSVTNVNGSPLANLGHLRFVNPTESPNEAAGYSTAMLTVFLIALRLGELLGSLTPAQADELRSEIRGSADDMEATLESCQAEARALAQQHGGLEHVLFLGSGPHFGTALNGAARVLETVGTFACAQDIEEWVHLHRFARAKVPTFVIAPPGPSRERAQEVLDALRTLERQSIAVVDERDTELISRATTHLPVRCSLREELSPLVYSLPAELYADYLSLASGEPPFRAGDPRFQRVGEIRWGGFVRTVLAGS